MQIKFAKKEAAPQVNSQSKTEKNTLLFAYMLFFAYLCSRNCALCAYAYVVRGNN